MLRVSLQEKILFVKHLSIMIKSGMPLLDSLFMLQKQVKSKAMAKILNRLAVDVSNGQFLSASLEQFGSIFGDLFVHIIKVGESTGVLADNLTYLAEELRKKQALRRKVIGAMLYPIVVLMATFGLTAGLTIMVFPKILPIFSSFDVKLPITTRILIIVSNFLINYGGWVALGALVFFLGIFLLLKIPSVKFLYHRILLKVPVIGGLVKRVNLANLCRTLGVGLKSGIQVVDALMMTADSVTNRVYQKELKVVAEDLTKGEAIAKHLEKHRAIFPPMVVQMVAVGESTGNLTDTFFYLSDFYEAEVDELTKNMANLLEPFLMIVLGVVVGFIAIAIITPIYGITQAF